MRHLDFLKSITEAAQLAGRPFLSQTVLKALNFHAIACLHTNAGQYRPVAVGNARGKIYPDHWRVPDMMDDFTNFVNRGWVETDRVELAAYVLWRLNYIHPLINGNGRTARAACLFVLCLKSGGWLPYEPILPVLIRRDGDEYVEILGRADTSFEAGRLDLAELVGFLQRLLIEQVATAKARHSD